MPAIGSATNQSVSSEDLGGGNHGQDLRVGREILAPAQRGRRPLLLTPSSLYSVFACLCFNTHTHTHRQRSRSLTDTGMYTTGLNPFYASNFSLWSAYCAGGFAVDSMKKPSFCIADILQAGEAENIPASSALVVHMGHHHHHHHHQQQRAQQQQQQQQHSGTSPLRPSPVAPDASVYGARLSPASPYHRHGLQLTSVSRTAFNSQQAPPPSSKDLKFGIDRILSADFDPKGKDKSSLRGEWRKFIYTSKLFCH